jgi:hypothetical protein
VIVRPLAQDFDWDQDADGALDGAFAATPFTLDGF